MKEKKKKRIPCIIYTRVLSRKHANEGAGLASQERTCRDYAEKQGYEVVDVVTDIISGTKADRPGMKAVLDYLREHRSEPCVVVVDDISRFARDVSIHASLRDKIMASGAKIESPKQKFGEDAAGRFIEILMAAVAEHAGAHNAEQSRRRTLARLHAGFWVFSAPLGYQYVSAPGGGKRLVHSEPLAGIIQEALQGFADGRFQSQAEVKRFLESKPDFPRSYNGIE